MTGQQSQYLILKYYNKEKYRYLSFEIVSRSIFRGTTEVFQDIKGKEFTPSTKEDLYSFLLSDLDIYRVIPISYRDTNKKYNISQYLILQIFFKIIERRIFFYISILRSIYRAQYINIKRDLYIVGSSQKLNIELSRIVEQKVLEAEIKKLKDNKLEIVLETFRLRKISEY